MGTYNGNGHNGSVYVHRLNGELVVAVGVNGEEALRRQTVLQPKGLTKSHVQYIEDLVRALPREALIPIHPSTPDVLYAGSPKHGFVLSIDPQYTTAEQLEVIIDELNK